MNISSIPKFLQFNLSACLYRTKEKITESERGPKPRSSIPGIKQTLTENRPEPQELPLLIMEGFLVFTDRYLSSVCHHKLFFTLSREECWARRSVRTYDPPDVPGYFQQVVWPEYERHLHLALTINQDLTFVPGTRDIHSVVQDFVEVLSREGKFK